MDIRGRTIMLTGAAGGVGAAAARMFAARGGRLLLVDVQDQTLRSLAAELGDDVVPIPADITDLARLEAAAATAQERFGGIDIVVANAAVDAIAPIADIEPEVFDRVVEVNLLGTFRTVRAALPAMEGRAGHILVVSSLGALVPPPYQSAYAASKAGMSALADSLRLELRGSGTTVGVLYFGGIDTEHFRTGMAHPLMQRVNANVPKSFTTAAPVEQAADAIARAIERRSRRDVFPRSNRPMLWAPATMQRIAERWIRN